jgi:glyoxylase-like metal-dependent hydrolase (beta-lactamase superfamily II)
VAALADGLELIDTRLGGVDRITAAFLVRGERPALVETGARTSAATVREALTAAGLGSGDLAWIVLTHIHLDHCGGTGLLARDFPGATVVVHRRGARHLADPERLVAASFAVYGEEMAPLYGGLDPVAMERIVAAEDGQRVPLGPGRELVMLETLGHARHHMSVLDEATGTMLAGDALGVRFGAGGLYQALPPPDVDIERGIASLRRLALLRPEALVPSHFGPVPDPAAFLEEAERQQRAMGEAALGAWRASGTATAVATALEAALPLEATVHDPAAIERWRMLRWLPNNAAGLTAWAAAQSDGGAG